MARYQVILAYDGTHFKGFQRQAGKSEARTVQRTFESALRKLGWIGRSILSAGRTDSGVHASGQVVAFDLEWQHSRMELIAALNANLPVDIAVRDLFEVGSDFHPRYDALSRRYCYRIFVDPIRNPLHERFAWRVWPEVDVGLLHQAAACLVGTHDFRAFGTPPHSGGTTVRSIRQANWIEDQETLVFDIQANAFLYRMVRKLVGYQIKIGQGKLELAAINERLKDQSTARVKSIAPAQGLTLVSVEYVQ